jgi:pyrroloquinoline quinone (PQQ) biosynthesis protein C
VTTTVLPIPEQEGFRVLLPQRVRLHPATQVRDTPAGLRLERNETILTVSMPPAARDALLRALDERGAGMATAGLSVAWRQLLEKLAAAGMLVAAGEAEPTGDEVPALVALATVLDTIHAQTRAVFATDHPVNRLIAGELTQDVAVRWLVENYYYTRGASYHVAPVLDHVMSESERALWARFLKDEAWHWRIYRPAFGQFRLSFAELDAREPRPSTRHFVRTLHSIARTSPIAYAATMIFIEKPPLWTDVDSDPLYTSLMRCYGFSPAAIRPLWWHATENATAGHSALGAVVISNRETVGRRELATALNAVRDTICAVGAWQADILSSD